MQIKVDATEALQLRCSCGQNDSVCNARIKLRRHEKHLSVTTSEVQDGVMRSVNLILDSAAALMLVEYLTMQVRAIIQDEKENSNV
jgi:hypothetical protein